MKLKDRAKMLRLKIENLAEVLTDEESLSFEELFPLWVVDHNYSVGDRVRDEDVLYKCVQAHVSQESWKPSLTPALWTRVSIDEWPEWIQPTGTQNAYMMGDKVSHNEKHWVSTADNNVWEPGVYGWDEAE